MTNPSPVRYVLELAVEWAKVDPMQRWIFAAPDASMPTLESVDDELIADYLNAHNPFPDEAHVEVADREAAGQWNRVIVEDRTDQGEWSVYAAADGVYDGDLLDEGDWVGCRSWSELRLVPASELG